MSTLRTVYHESAGVTVSWDETLPAVVVEFDDTVPSEQYRTALAEGLALLEDRDCNRLCVDVRELGTISRADDEWTQTDWLASAGEAGLEDVAVVHPPDVVEEMDTESLVTEFDDLGLVMHTFDDPEAARSWLEEQ